MQFPNYDGHLLFSTLQRSQRADRSVAGAQGLLTFVWKLENQFWPPCLDNKAIPSPSVQHYCCTGAVTCADLLFILFFRDVPWCLHPQALKDVVVPVDHKKHTCVFPKCVGFSHKDREDQLQSTAFCGAGTVVPAWAVVLHLSCKISFCGGFLLLLLLGTHSRNTSSLENDF